MSKLVGIGLIVANLIMAGINLQLGLYVLVPLQLCAAGLVMIAIRDQL